MATFGNIQATHYSPHIWWSHGDTETLHTIPTLLVVTTNTQWRNPTQDPEHPEDLWLTLCEVAEVSYGPGQEQVGSEGMGSNCQGQVGRCRSGSKWHSLGPSVLFEGMDESWDEGMDAFHKQWKVAKT